MPRTRTTKSSAKPATDSIATTTTSKYELSEPRKTRRQVLVFPSKATSEARIVTLPHPRHSKPSRYLVCPQTGFYEFTKVKPAKGYSRSWLIQPQQTVVEDHPESNQDEAELVSDAELYLATGFDPVFLIIPSLFESQSPKHPDGKKRRFLSSDDYFDQLPEEHSHLNEILRWPSARSLLEARMAEICDTTDVGDEIMFRGNEEKLANAILRKAEQMAEGGLPPSMEEKFVLKALEAPLKIQNREMGFEEITSIVTDTEVSTPSLDTSESQSVSVVSDTSTSGASLPSTAATSFVEHDAAMGDVVAAMTANENIKSLQRSRVALKFLCELYIKPATAEHLENSISQDLRFAPLEDYLKKLGQLKAEAMAARSMCDYSGKRKRDEEEDEAHQEKKRKEEDDKKRKASESRAVRELKKVNTSGMKKLSHFFQKK